MESVEKQKMRLNVWKQSVMCTLSALRIDTDIEYRRTPPIGTVFGQHFIMEMSN